MDNQVAIINFLTTSTTHRENFGLSNGYVQNMYLDDNNFMRNFWGYKKITDFLSPLVAFAIDVTGNYYFGMNQNNEFVIYSKSYNVLLTINLAALIQTDAIIKNYLNSVYCSILQLPNGNLMMINGGFCGLFLVTLKRDDQREILLQDVKVVQYPYISGTDYDPITKQFSKLKFPKYLEFFDDKVLVTDGSLNLVYFSNNLFTTAPTIWSSIAISSRADKIQKAVRIERTLCIVGENCVEFYYPSQDEFGFAKYNWLVESGTVFPNSITVLNGKLIYLGSNDNSSPEVTIVDLKEQKFIELNKNGLSLIFENLPESDDVFGLNFSPSGQNFYILHYTEAKTLLINIDTNDYFFLTDENRKAALMDDIFRDQNSWIFLGKDGQIYKMSSDIFDYNGTQIPMIIKPSLTQSDLNFTLKKLIVLMRPHFTKSAHIEEEGAITLFANVEDFSNTEGVQSNYNLKKCYQLPINYERTRYFDENMPSIIYNVCQLYSEIRQLQVQYKNEKVFYPVIFSKFDIEVEFI